VAHRWRLLYLLFLKQLDAHAGGTPLEVTATAVLEETILNPFCGTPLEVTVQCTLYKLFLKQLDVHAGGTPLEVTAHAVLEETILNLFCGTPLEVTVPAGFETT